MVKGEERRAWPARCPPGLSRVLRKYARRLARERCLAILSGALVVALAALLAGLVADCLFDLSAPVRAVPLWILYAACGVGLVWLVAAAARRRASPETLAGRLDLLAGGTKDSLRSAVNFLVRVESGEKPGHEFLVERSVELADRTAAGLDLARLHPYRRARQRGAAALVLLAVLAALARIPGVPCLLLVQRFFDPFGNYPRPSWTLIETDAKPVTRLEAGGDLSVRATLSGRVPDPPSATLVIEPAGQKASEQRQAMQPLPDGSFRGLVRNVRSDFRFWIEAGDGRTERYFVQALQPPQIVAMTARYSPPRYARQKERTEPVQYRELRALAGTAVTVEFKTDSPIQEASATIETIRKQGGAVSPELAGLQPGDNVDKTAMGIFLKQTAHKAGKDNAAVVVKPLAVAWDANARTGRFHLTIDESGLLRINLKGTNGVTNRFDPTYKVTAIPDNPPAVSILNLPEETTLRPDDLLQVRYLARDDLGIADLQYKVTAESRGGSEINEFIPLAKFGAKEVEGEVAIPAQEIAPLDRYVPAGGHQDATVDFYLAAVDTNGQTANSRRVRITVLRETYDRAVEELLRHLADLDEATAANLAKLNSSMNSLVVLRDSIGPENTWSDDRQRTLEEISRKLQFAAFTNWEAYQRNNASRFSLYPYRAQQASDCLQSYSSLSSRGFARLGELGRAANRREALGAALSALEGYRDFLTAYQAAIQSTMRWLRRDELLYLIELSRRDLRDYSASGGGEYAQLFKERQGAGGAKIVGLVESLGLAAEGSALAAAAASLKSAAVADDLAAIARSVEQVRSALLGDTSFTADRNDALEAFRRTYDDAWLLAQGQREKQAGLIEDPLGLAKGVWADDLDLSGDATVSDEPMLAARALALIRLLAGEREPAALLGLVASARPASEAYCVRVHLNQAYEEARWLVDGVDAGRLKPGDSEIERAWNRFRDILLVLLDRYQTGSLSTIEPRLRGALDPLVAARALVLRWDIGAIQTHPPDWQSLRRLTEQLEVSRAQALDPPTLPGCDPAAWLLQACDRLAVLFEAERADAERQLERLREEARNAPDFVPDARQHWSDNTRGAGNSAYGEAKEKVILQYAAAHRKLLDLFEVQTITSGTLPLPVLRQHAATVEYLWWLANDVALSFGRYEGPSVVRRHASGAKAYLEKMKDYPANLGRAAAAFRHLASPATLQASEQPSATLPPPIEALVKTSRTELNLKHEYAQLERFGTSLDLARGKLTPEQRGTEIGRAYGDPIQGAFVADRIAIPLRAILSSVLPAASAGEDVRQVSPPAPQTLTAAFAAARAAMQELPEKPRGTEELLASLDTLQSALARDGTKLGDDERQEIGAQIGSLLETLAPKINLPPIPVKMSKLFSSYAMLNDATFYCQERANRLWQLEMGRQRRYYEREYVDTLFRRTPNGDAGQAWHGLAAQFAHCRVAARKSIGAQREAGGSLDVRIEGIRYDLLAMPKYLYDELIRANGEPYPEQFKEQGLRYMQGLLEDAKR